MALRFISVVRLRALVLILVTGALLGLMVHQMVARAWEESFEREAEAAAQSIAAALAWKALPAEFICAQMPMGNIQSIRIEGPTGGSYAFHSSMCPSMRDAIHAPHCVVREATALGAAGDSVRVIVSTWDPARDRLAGDVAGFIGILCAAILAFVFVVSTTLRRRYDAGIGAVTAQTGLLSNGTSANQPVATFEELADMSHMFRIVRESAARDAVFARDTYTAQGMQHSPLNASWHSEPFELTALRLDSGDESGCAWAWRSEASLYVLLARFDGSPPENVSEFGLMWRAAMESRQVEDLDGITAAFAPDGYCCCEYGLGADQPRVVCLHNMQEPAPAANALDASVMTTAAPCVPARTWLIVRHEHGRRKA